MTLKPQNPEKIIHKLISTNNFFPNNQKYPFLVYKQALKVESGSNQLIKDILKQNHWTHAWVDSIYDFHHYHSNTHEVLAILQGTGNVQVGGPNAEIFEIAQGDIIIIPVGVAHKSAGLSPDFLCVGAYPFDLDYDMNYGKAEEHPKVDENIRNVELPSHDPVFGKDGPLFDYWK